MSAKVCPWFYISVIICRDKGSLLILAQLACPLSDVIFCLHSEITNLSLYKPWNTKGGSITVLLTSCWTRLGISCMTTEIFCFYLQNRLIQTSQTGGQWYSDTFL
jgi:hypothetical protein